MVPVFPRALPSALVSAVTALSIASAVSACGRAPRTYPVSGQVLAVHADRQEVTLKHGDIPGFMPGMTMAFKVADAAVLRERTPGELITATLVLSEPAPHLRQVTRVGFAELPAEPAARPAMDVVEPGAAVRDTSLVDEAGATRRLQDWRGRVLAVTFTYTRCPLPNFCPLVERHFSAAAREIAADPELREHVQLLAVTLDPEHDTPSVLAAHARKLGAPAGVWSFLTGPAGTVASFAEQFGVSVIREGKAPADLVHNLRTAVIGADGKLVKVLGGADWTPAELLAEIRDARRRN